jgi:cellulose synthase/poly-beta-1,6-N-acetylglucosamine synthase-like glycosyltransferase
MIIHGDGHGRAQDFQVLSPVWYPLILMEQGESIPEISVIVPARNEEACLADCLHSLVGQAGPAYEVIVVDDHSTDGTRAIAESFCAPTLSQQTQEDGAPTVRVISAGELPPGWSGKCNAAWSGAKAAQGKWLLFTDADTRHSPNSIARGLQEAKANSADMLSYSPRQEVRGFAERALMPVIFAELATAYPPKEVCNPKSPVAAANGQYLLIRREAYDAVGGHAAVATTLLEDVALAKRLKQAGFALRFGMSDAVSTRMYRSFPQMWEGWTKNLALLFPNPRRLALWRALEFAAILAMLTFALVSLYKGDMITFLVAAAVTVQWLYLFGKRLARAHFDRLSNTLAFFGLPLFAVLLLNSSISHVKGIVRWKGREYSGSREAQPADETAVAAGNTLAH